MKLSYLVLLVLCLFFMACGDSTPEYTADYPKPGEEKVMPIDEELVREDSPAKLDSDEIIRISSKLNTLFNDADKSSARLIENIQLIDIPKAADEKEKELTTRLSIYETTFEDKKALEIDVESLESIPVIKKKFIVYDNQLILVDVYTVYDKVVDGKPVRGDENITNKWYYLNGERLEIRDGLGAKYSEEMVQSLLWLGENLQQWEVIKKAIEN